MAHFFTFQHPGSATDSLGTVRELSTNSSAVARETMVADVLRAFLMYGVSRPAII